MGKIDKQALKKFLTIIFLLIGFILLILSSELIFIYKNQMYLFVARTFTKVSLKAAQISLNKEKIDRTFFFLDISAIFRIKQNQIYFPNKIPNTLVKSRLAGIDTQVKEKIFNILRERLPKAEAYNDYKLISNIYYHSGLILYNRNYHETANSFFQTSVYLDPDLSFLHVELANSYFDDGESDKGMKALEYCLEFDPPKKHCQEYIDLNVRINSFKKVGEFKDIIDEYQTSKDTGS